MKTYLILTGVLCGLFTTGCDYIQNLAITNGTTNQITLVTTDPSRSHFHAPAGRLLIDDFRGFYLNGAHVR